HCCDIKICLYNSGALVWGEAMTEHSRTEQLLTALRAVAEPSRLRLLFIISHGEFNVTELTQILGQSQPRVSRHLKLLGDARLIERHREGSWVLFRLADRDES